jgi:hypothetical protein
MTEKTKETLGLQSFHYENVARATYTNLIIRKKKTRRFYDGEGDRRCEVRGGEDKGGECALIDAHTCYAWYAHRLHARRRTRHPMYALFLCPSGNIDVLTAS